MITFLFEQYGYYPESFKDNTFIIKEWVFKLIEVEQDEVFIDKVDEYIKLIRDQIPGKGPYIIKTRYNKKISMHDGKKYVLVSIRKCNMSMRDLNKIHVTFKQNEGKVDLRQLLLLWKERLTYIEIEAVNSLKIDSIYYKKNLENTMFCLGLTQNAIQYLSDLIADYTPHIEGVSLTHRRLMNLESFDILNPFNFIIDHPIRDLCELYKTDYLSFSELVSSMEYYQLDTTLASFFMCRLLYPTYFLDALERNALSKEVGLDMNYNIQKEMEKMRKMYVFLRDIYNIRRINWLEN